MDSGFRRNEGNRVKLTVSGIKKGRDSGLFNENVRSQKDQAAPTNPTV